MAVEITGRYTGQLKTEMTHGPSGAVLRTATSWNDSWEQVKQGESPMTI